MGARRYKSLHFGDMEGKNVVFHREHRSKRGRTQKRAFGMIPYKEGRRNDWKQNANHLLQHTVKVKNHLV